MKELPKMYHSKINKSLDNVQKVYSTIEKHENMEDNINQGKYSHVSIDKKINNIFNDNGFVYKADVTIVTDTNTIRKRIVARNVNNLITIDNEYIPISLIRDIDK